MVLHRGIRRRSDTARRSAHSPRPKPLRSGSSAHHSRRLPAARSCVSRTMAARSGLAHTRAYGATTTMQTRRTFMVSFQLGLVRERHPLVRRRFRRASTASKVKSAAKADKRENAEQDEDQMVMAGCIDVASDQRIDRGADDVAERTEDSRNQADVGEGDVLQGRQVIGRDRGDARSRPQAAGRWPSRRRSGIPPGRREV